MWYPEEPITYCEYCDLELPSACFWRGRGYVISRTRRIRTTILHSLCPECGTRQSIGLEGPVWFQALYNWLWSLRYPRRRAPRLGVPAERSGTAGRRRAVGE